MAERASEIISSSNIVLLGSFNPKIFQPEWFARQGLLPQAEVDAAEVKVIAQPISHFETERFTVFVTEQQFIAASKPDASPAPLRDLVSGTFFILEHTPVTAMGLNRQMHIPMESEAEWHQIGDMLAPKDCWKEVLEGRPGLLTMTILTNKSEPQGAQFRIKVEPSTQVTNGVYFETNEHYPGAEKESLQSLMEILNRRWEEAQNEAERVIRHVLSWAKRAK
jgi:hypothetical protein